MVQKIIYAEEALGIETMKGWGIYQIIGPIKVKDNSRGLKVKGIIILLKE